MRITNELKILLNHKFYFSSLIIAFLIPDVCSALSSRDGEAKPDRYKLWFNKYMAQYKPLFSGDDAYNYRCGLIHQGKLKHLNSKYESVVFTISKNFIFNNCIQMIDNKKQYICDVNIFCNDIIKGYYKWRNENIKSSIYKENMK